MIVKRGEIYLTKLPDQSKPRPAIVFTADWLSEYALDLSLAPVTGVARSNFPTRVELPAGDGGLRKRSWAKCDQVTTVPKNALIGRAFGRGGVAKLAEIEDAVRLALAL